MGDLPTFGLIFEALVVRDIRTYSDWLVEVKRKKEIGREIESEVERKVNALSRPEGVSSKTALVYDGHLSPLMASDGYFDAIIPFRQLLNLA